MFWVRTRFSDSEHVSPTQRTFPRLRTRFYKNVSELGVRSFGKTCSESELTRFLTQSTFLRLTARFSDSEHVSPKFSELGVRSFGKTCSEWEHVSPTQNTFLRLRTRFTKFSELGVRSFGSEWEHENVFWLSARFPDSEHVSTKFSELGVRSFGKTCSEWEHVSLTQSTFLRLTARFDRTQNTFLQNFRSWELGVLEKRVLSENVSPTQNTFLWLRARFSKFSESGVRNFGKTCSEWEHVSPTQNTFLRNFRSWELGVLEKRVLSENTFHWLRDVSPNTFLRLRTRFYEIFGVRS